MPAQDDLAARLTPALEQVYGESGVGVHGLRRLSGGASRETWSFEVVRRAGAEPLVLRRDPPEAPRPDLMMLEAAALQEAARVGVPEPEVLLASGDAAVLGSPFILMRHVEGETIARRILRDDTFAAVRPHLAAQCGTILARVHAMDPAALPEASGEDVLGLLADRLETMGWPSPVLELALRWLGENRPPPTGDAVVHGDFRNGNLIIGPDGVRAVLDWEVVHRGDPMEDLGWLCVRAWRFGAAPPVGGFGSYDDLFAAYEQASGRTVDPDVVRWWELLGTVRWGVGCMGQCMRHLSGTTRSVELAAIGRRVCEQEYDALLLLRELLGARA